jgi:hypothetical protein
MERRFSRAFLPQTHRLRELDSRNNQILQSALVELNAPSKLALIVEDLTVFRDVRSGVRLKDEFNTSRDFDRVQLLGVVGNSDVDCGQPVNECEIFELTRVKTRLRANKGEVVQNSATSSAKMLGYKTGYLVGCTIQVIWNQSV